RGLLFENVVEELFRCVWSVDFLGRFQHVQSELVTIGLKQIVAPTRQPIDHLRPAHSLWATPCVEITVAVKSDAMLLDAHVAHPLAFPSMSRIPQPLHSRLRSE